MPRSTPQSKVTHDVTELHLIMQLEFQDQDKSEKNLFPQLKAHPSLSQILSFHKLFQFQPIHIAPFFQAFKLYGPKLGGPSSVFKCSLSALRFPISFFAISHPIFRSLSIHRISSRCEEENSLVEPIHLYLKITHELTLPKFVCLFSHFLCL